MCKDHPNIYILLARDPSQSDVIVEGKNYVNGYLCGNRLSPLSKTKFVSLHHTIIWQKRRLLLVPKGPTKCGADLRAYQSCSLVGWIRPANCCCSFWCCCVTAGCLSIWTAYWKRQVHSTPWAYMADLQQARWILRIDCGPVDLADPLFYRCLFADLLISDDRLRTRP